MQISSLCWSPPIRQSHRSRSHNSSVAVPQLIGRLTSSHSTILPPSRDDDHTGLDGEPALFVGTLLFPPHFSTPPLSHFYTFRESASSFLFLFLSSPHFSNLNSLLVSSPRSQTKPEGGGGGGLVHILTFYFVSSPPPPPTTQSVFPSEYPAFSAGESEKTHG